jgi:hypothetical protein
LLPEYWFANSPWHIVLPSSSNEFSDEQNEYDAAGFDTFDRYIVFVVGSGAVGLG